MGQSPWEWPGVIVGTVIACLGVVLIGLTVWGLQVYKRGNQRLAATRETIARARVLPLLRVHLESNPSLLDVRLVNYGVGPALVTGITAKYPKPRPTYIPAAAAAAEHCNEACVVRSADRGSSFHLLTGLAYNPSDVDLVMDLECAAGAVIKAHPSAGAAHLLTAAPRRDGSDAAWQAFRQVLRRNLHGVTLTVFYSDALGNPMPPIRQMIVFADIQASNAPGSQRSAGPRRTPSSRSAAVPPRAPSQLSAGTLPQPPPEPVRRSAEAASLQSDEIVRPPPEALPMAEHTGGSGRRTGMPTQLQQPPQAGGSASDSEAAATNLPHQQQGGRRATDGPSVAAGDDSQPSQVTALDVPGAPPPPTQQQQQQRARWTLRNWKTVPRTTQPAQAAAAAQDDDHAATAATPPSQGEGAASPELRPSRQQHPAAAPPAALAAAPAMNLAASEGGQVELEVAAEVEASTAEHPTRADAAAAASPPPQQTLISWIFGGR